MAITRSYRMLVVDDEPDMSRGLRRILKLKGLDVRIADSGEMAIVIAREWNPDGILMDIKMTGINGVDAYRKIRPICPNAFVIFMTAYSSFAEEALREGAVDVLSKPLNIDQLCELVEKSLVTRPILIVDDDVDFAKSLKRVLMDRGFQVDTVQSPQDAIAYFDKIPRAAVILDMRLGDTTGLELLDSLKARNRNALVVEVTGYPDMVPLMKDGIAMSATAGFTKPLDMDGFLSTIEMAMLNAGKPH